MADTPNRTVPVSEDLATAASYDEAATAAQDVQNASAEADRKRTLIEAALKRWKLVEEAEREQRAQEAEDLRFDRGRREDHWDAAQIRNRSGGMSPDGVPVAERPCLVINKLAVPVAQVTNEGRASRIALVVKAKPGAANDKEAEIRQGILRAIEVDSDANSARMWAYERAVKCGRGYYRVEKKYANDGDFEMDLVVSRIKNQGAVYIDPYHQEPDASDIAFAFITEDLPRDEFKARYAADYHAICDLTGDELQSVTDKAPDWVLDGNVRVAEHFWVETKRRYLVELPDGQRALVDDPPPRTSGIRVRPVEVRQVRWMLMNALDVLEEAEWDGRYIPVIQVLGREINVDGKSTYKGIITDSKDGQRVYNYAVSAEVEAAALAPRAPFIAAYGQIEKFKRVWETANIRNYTYLPYTPIASGGYAVPPPQRNQVEPPLMGLNTLVIQADNDIKATTGRWDASLGQLNQTDRSGKALRELKMQAELGSSNYLDSLAKSVRHEGRILLDLVPKTYVEPGRLMKLLGDEPGDEKMIIANAPFVMEGQTPMPAPQPGGAMAFFQNIKRKLTNAPEPEVMHYDLTKGDFSVVVDVGPSYKTQREENIAFLQSMVEADPNLAPAIGDIMAEEMGGPMGRKLAKRLRSMNPNLPKDEDASSDPDVLQAQVHQLEQAMQAMQQAMQEAMKAVETNEAKQRATLEVARMKAQADFEIAKLKLQGDMALLRSKITSDEELARFDAAMKLALQDDEQRHDLEMARLDAMTAAITASRDEAQHERDEARADLRARDQANREDRRTIMSASIEDRRASEQARREDARADLAARNKERKS